MALQLRTTDCAIDAKLHPHSKLSKRLALALVESDIYLQTNLCYVGAWAGLSSHSKLDIKASLKAFNKIFNTAKSAVPYLSSMTHKILDTDTQELVDKFRTMDKAKAKAKELDQNKQ